MGLLTVTNFCMACGVAIIEIYLFVRLIYTLKQKRTEMAGELSGEKS